MIWLLAGLMTWLMLRQRSIASGRIRGGKFGRFLL